MFGVQSQRNYEQDFSSSSPMPFIIVGVIFVVLFVVSLVLLVNLVTA